jgi:Carbon-nitrogen hydrolase
MTDYPKFTLAAIQAAPVYFDRDSSTKKACKLIEQAAGEGATLAAFSETWLPGYPFFHNSLRRTEAVADYLANAVEIPSSTTDSLCRAAHNAGIDVVIGESSSMSELTGLFIAPFYSLAVTARFSAAIENLSPPILSALFGEKVTESDLRFISTLRPHQRFGMLGTYDAASRIRPNGAGDSDSHCDMALRPHPVRL